MLVELSEFIKGTEYKINIQNQLVVLLYSSNEQLENEILKYNLKLQLTMKYFR